MIRFLIIFVVVALVLAGGYLYYQSSQKKLATPPKETMVSLSPTQEPIVPTPTAEEFEIDQYKIEVQNGSGVAGRAAKVKDALEEAGFIVDKTGNADTSDFEKSIIYAPSDINSGFLAKLKELISETYELESKESDVSDIKTLSDIVIIIGKNEVEATSSAEEEPAE